MTNLKTVKQMVLFFDFLYESADQIGQEVLADWSHKETPKTVFAVIDAEDMDLKEMPSENAFIYKTLADAQAEADEWNEDLEVVPAVEEVKTVEVRKYKCDCCLRMVASQSLEIVVVEEKEFDGLACPTCKEELENN